MKNELSGKRVLITGGTRGIGFAIAEKLAAAGVCQILTFREDDARATDAAGLISAFNVPCKVLKSDASDIESVERLVTDAVEFLGGLDFLIHNAGPFEMGAIADMPIEKVKYLIDANFTSAIALAKAAIPHLRNSEYPSIVFLGGVNSGNISAGPGTGVYTAAKNALASLTKTLAAEEGPNGIRVNMICPGFVDTGGYSDEFKERQSKKIPLRRIGNPRDIADPVCWLLTSEARYISGAILDAGGGVML